MKKRRIYYLLFTVLVLIGCEKDIEIALNEQSDKLVMYAFVYPDSALHLHLSKSQNILTPNDYQKVEKGRFELAINDDYKGTYILPSDTVWSRWAEFSFSSKDRLIFNAYEIDGDTVLARSFIPHKVNILALDTLSVNVNVGEEVDVPMLRTTVSFKDPGDEKNYYQLYVLREGWGVEDGKVNYTRQTVSYAKEDPVFTQGEQSGSLLPGLDLQGLFADDIINGRTHPLRLNIPSEYFLFSYHEQKIKITVYLYHHTIDYYEYLRSTILADGYAGIYEGLPVFEPVKIHSNVKGGLGLVSGMNFDSDSLVFTRDIRHE
ncbi:MULTISPECIES: DUF4249 domain-containing protein [unclassified Carboxylicivirga]|uniref:DUF4249 domain-containing protein n=1 Tax=Carboxylicivirga TaxID=1628153 RepID=UPI003D341F91